MFQVGEVLGGNIQLKRYVPLLDITIRQLLEDLRHSRIRAYVRPRWVSFHGFFSPEQGDGSILTS